MKPNKPGPKRNFPHLGSPPKKPNRALLHSKEIRARLAMMKKLLHGAGLSHEEARYVVAHSFPSYTKKPFDSMTQHDIERRLEMVREIQFVRSHALTAVTGAKGEGHRARLQLFYDILHHPRFTPNMIRDRLIGLANRLAEAANEKEQLQLIAAFRKEWMGS